MRHLSILFLLTACTSSHPPVTLWNRYTGEIHGNITVGGSSDFIVKINETRYGENPRQLIVHVRPLDAPAYVGITGHDYNNDGTWDRIFRCGYPEEIYGCNSVIRERRSYTSSEFHYDSWVFDPCPANVGMVPFTQHEIGEAKAILELARGTFYSADFLVCDIETCWPQSRTPCEARAPRSPRVGCALVFQHKTPSKTDGESWRDAINEVRTYFMQESPVFRYELAKLG